MGSLAIAIVASYLLGSISGSLWLGRLVGVDIRQRGSGNAGGTNAFRTLGWKFALGVVLIDIGKGALAGWIGVRMHDADASFSSWTQGFACVLAAAIGHTWPVFHGFRGGKGAAALVGGLLVLWPVAVPWLFLTWTLLLTLTGYVGLATVCATAMLVPLALLIGDMAPVASFAFALAATAFLLYTHRANLARLRAGNEHRFTRARIWARWWSRMRSR